ncbi:hypothetical protein FZEAL_5195 [Fusarium zealandicum]|uniref:Uncharacterized protein n=1 Tax=Fusarium zealandicum TaxID=1053134 RepID=A0A8H4UKP8_9HYPO|nr:hypothetical protein FZEAL_5195 [Fusarium zealandicum]
MANENDSEDPQAYLIRNRTWYFIPFLMGCLFEAVGYIGRTLSANEAPGFTKNPYIIQSILLLLGPALFAASIYMILSPERRGENIIIGGLGIQILFFGFFIIVTLMFHMRIPGQPTQTSLEITNPWKKLVLVLYVTSLLILVRSAFRVAEYVVGKDGELQSKELWVYIVDALLMAIATLLLNWFHPSRVINRALDAKRIPSPEEYALES